MGKRDLNAELTRRAVLEAAVDAFEEHGYEAVTMEQVAAGASIGIATLYRHFPTKDSILAREGAAGIERVSQILATRPPDEPLGEALANTLLQVAQENTVRTDLSRRVADLLLTAAGPRRLLLESWATETATLAAVIRHRMDVGDDELWVDLTAHTTMTIYEITLLRLGGRLDEHSGANMFRTLTSLLAAPAFVLPRFPEVALQP